MSGFGIFFAFLEGRPCSTVCQSCELGFESCEDGSDCVEDLADIRLNSGKSGCRSRDSVWPIPTVEDASSAVSESFRFLLLLEVSDGRSQSSTGEGESTAVILGGLRGVENMSTKYLF